MSEPCKCPGGLCCGAELSRRREVLPELTWTLASYCGSDSGPVFFGRLGNLLVDDEWYMGILYMETPGGGQRDITPWHLHYGEGAPDWTSDPATLATIRDAVRAEAAIVRRATYVTYLAGPAWAAIRAKALKRDGFKCMKCKTTHRLQVHHLTYDRLYREDLNDLATLCHACHEALHGH